MGKRLLLHLLKAGLSLGLLAYLVRSIIDDDPEAFSRLLREPKQWAFLLAAWGCFAAALLANLARWHILVRAAALRWRGGDTLRTGLMAYMLDFAALGAVGGDLFKALSVHGHNPGRGVDALTTVVADRLVGLAGLLAFSSFWLWWLGATALTGVLPALARVVPAACALAALGAVALLALGRNHAALVQRVAAWRVPGAHLANVVRAAAQYGRRPWVLMQAFAVTLAILLLNATGYTLLVLGLPGTGPTFLEHLLIVPIASLSGMVPLPADTLGVLDLAMSHLYEHATGGRVSAGMGVMAVMAYRCVGVAVTALGLVYFSTAHGGVRAALQHTLHRDVAPDPR